MRGAAVILGLSVGIGLGLAACQRSAAERSDPAVMGDGGAGPDASLPTKVKPPARPGLNSQGTSSLRDGGKGSDADAGLVGDAGPIAGPDAGPDAAADAGADACVAAPERCNGEDDDCDGQADEGFDVGAACDGPDADECRQGTLACAEDGEDVVCMEATTVIADEVCDGSDNDCDGEVDEGFGVGEPCDGPDSDLCTDGVVECVDAEHAACADDPRSALDLCNGVDDDCDPASADGSEDPAIGGPCDGDDGDRCQEGQWICSGGERMCSDNTGTTSDDCGGGDEDCDGAVDEHRNPNNDPACSTAESLRAISGDTGEQVVETHGYGERWFRIRISENNTSSLYLSALVELVSPEGADYDLYVYCASCGGREAGFSEVGEGGVDVVELRAEDTGDNIDDGFDVLIEVRHWSSRSCDTWQLGVFGNLAVEDTTCD